MNSRLFRILSLVVLLPIFAAGFNGLLLVVVGLYGGGPMLCSLWGYVLAVLLNAVFLFQTGRALWRSGAPKEESGLVPRPWLNALDFVLAGLVLDLLLFALLWLLPGELLLSWFSTVLLTLPPLIGGIAGYRCKRLCSRSDHVAVPISGIFCILLILLALNGVYAIAPHKFSYRSAKVEHWRYPRFDGKFLEAMLPPEATDVSIEGTAGFSTSISWRCRVDEASFRSFAARQGYILRANDGTWNVGEVGPIDYLGVVDFDVSPPRDFLSYADIHANGGGWVLVYDRATRELRGHFANR